MGDIESHGYVRALFNEVVVSPRHEGAGGATTSQKETVIPVTLRRFARLVALVAIVALAVPATISAANRAPTSASGSNAVIDWNANAGEAAIAACFFGAIPLRKHACTR